MRRYIYGAGLFVAAIVLSMVLYRCNKKVDNQIARPVLAADERSKVIFDARRHTVTRVDETGTHETFLNTHGPVAVVEKKDGGTVLMQRTWGTEFGPYFGGTLGTDFKLRTALGLNLFYVQRFEASAGLLLNVGNVRDVRAYIGITYNVYNNCLVGVALDSHKTAQLLAALRF